MLVVPFDGGSVKSMHSHLPRLNGSFEMILTTLKRNDSMFVFEGVAVSSGALDKLDESGRRRCAAIWLSPERAFDDDAADVSAIRRNSRLRRGRLAMNHQDDEASAATSGFWRSKRFGNNRILTAFDRLEQGLVDC